MSAKSSLSLNPVIDEGDYYTEVNGYVVPQNIRHRFRSFKTAELLADKDKVDRDRNDSEYVNIKQRTISYQHPPMTTPPPPSNPDYAKISNDLRTTVCRGHPVQRKSHSKTVHNGEVFEDVETKSNLHRRKKDWLGRWTEANIIRDRLYKSILEAQKKPAQ